jgi:hypothetical protein
MPAQQRRVSSADPIDKHVLGRRRRGRVTAAHQVDCQGPMNCFRGRVLNVSRDGALVSLTHRRFKANKDLDLVDVAARLQEEFPEGLTLRFLACPVNVQASMVRLARLADDGATVIGCEFARPLTFPECRLLGIRCTDRDASA